jgi:flagellar hook-associated protein 1 FlgK
VVERAMLLSDSAWLEPADFPALTGSAPVAAGLALPAEGVNLDQELISMTTYQQAFSASARLVQAGKDLYDVLLQMVG